MKKILVALVAISFVLAATLPGCGQKRCSVTAFDAEEEVLFDSGEVVEIVGEETEIIVSDDDEFLEGDFVVVDDTVVTTEIRTETEQEALERKVKTLDSRLKSNTDNLDEIIERQLGHVPSYTYAPKSEVVEEIIEEEVEIVEEVVIVDDDDGYISSKSAPADTKAPVADAKPAPAAQQQVATADYQKFMDIDTYSAEVDDEWDDSAMVIAPASFETTPAVVPPVKETKPAAIVVPPLETAQVSGGEREKKEDMKLPFDFPPSLSDSAAPADASEKTDGHSLSLDGFEDDGLEFFGRLSDSLLDEKEG